jgi:uncharacterized membrane protein
MRLSQLLIQIGYSGLRADEIRFFMGVVLTRIGMVRIHHDGFFLKEQWCSHIRRQTVGTVSSMVTCHLVIRQTTSSSLPSLGFTKMTND